MKHAGTMICSAMAAVLSFGTAMMGQTAAQQTPAKPTEAMELAKQGQALAREGKFVEALSAYRKAIALSPELYDAQLGAGTTLDLEGHYDEARRHLARAIELAPAAQKERALRTMAVSYAFTGSGKDAEKFEKQAFDARVAAGDFAGAGEVADELARIYLEAGDPANAHTWYQTGHETAYRKTDLSEADQDLWDFRWEHAQARIAARRGRHAEAEKHVAAAKVILDKGHIPQQAQFFPYLAGYVAYYAGDTKTAIGELQKGNLRDPFILSLVAQAYEKSGDKTQAMEYYRKVLDATSHNPTNAFARPLARKKLPAAKAQ